MATTGTGTPVDLDFAIQPDGIYQDGSTYTTGGLDGGGYSYSANLLTPSRVLNGVCSTLALPTIRTPSDAAANPSPPRRDNSRASDCWPRALKEINFAKPDGQLHRWHKFPFHAELQRLVHSAEIPGESEAVAMAYRNFDDGTKDKRIFNLYAYRFALDSSKSVQSVTLPNNKNVVVLAGTVAP